MRAFLFFAWGLPCSAPRFSSSFCSVRTSDTDGLEETRKSLNLGARLLPGGASRTTTTDSGGNYSFTNLANGSYTVTAGKAGCTFTRCPSRNLGLALSSQRRSCTEPCERANPLHRGSGGKTSRASKAP